MTNFQAMSGGSAGKTVSAMLCRKGVSGDWASAPLSKEQWAEVDMAFEEKLGTCRIAQPLRPWLEPPAAEDAPPAAAAAAPAGDVVVSEGGVVRA